MESIKGFFESNKRRNQSYDEEPTSTFLHWFPDISDWRLFNVPGAEVFGIPPASRDNDFRGVSDILAQGYNL